ncbi:hypothetical protein JTE90_021401 [Oedothorax gibbosus]|uniref:Uncharacterized protein n=1 Tax=Oedothorax gibbosus TaxID=931172 RepID=A0AAV6VDS2_9ARAC|nr:hypothetical protein JTE90_021401 [Oedothorax gibbosus]
MKPALLFCFWVVSTTISTNRGIPATLEAEAGTSQAAVETTLSPEDQSNSPSKQSKIPSLRIHIEIQIDHSSTKGTRVVLTLQPLPDTLATAPVSAIQSMFGRNAAVPTYATVFGRLKV